MRFLVVHPGGGLGNRLRALVSAKILADSLDRQLKVIWTPVEFFCPCQIEDLFENIPTISPECLKSKERLHYTVTNPVDIQKIEAQNDKADILEIHTCSAFKPSIMPLEVFQLQFQQELQNLTPLPEIRQRVLPDVENMIGLHIRQSDHWRATRYSPVALFVKIMNTNLKNYPDTRFYLCSESLAIKNYLDNRYGDSLVFQKYPRNATVGVQSAFVDMLTLARTKMIYRSRFTSFSFVAHQFYGTPLMTLSIIPTHQNWHGSYIDRVIDQCLYWDIQREQWMHKPDLSQAFLKQFSAFLVLISSRFVCSKFFQFYASRYLPYRSWQVNPGNIM